MLACNILSKCPLFILQRRKNGLLSWILPNVAGNSPYAADNVTVYLNPFSSAYHQHFETLTIETGPSVDGTSVNGNNHLISSVNTVNICSMICLLSANYSCPVFYFNDLDNQCQIRDIDMTEITGNGTSVDPSRKKLQGDKTTV